MKKIMIMAGIALFAGILPPVAQRANAQVNVSFQLFYDQLSPFGSWVSYPDYGYVWVPDAGSGFRPYGSRGHWVYTEDGWLWVSDYSWGWATFHYGNWFYDDSYGWMWMPGYEWAPAWVTWGEYGGNYCWAPIGPRIDIGVAYSTYRPPARYWNFCPRERITSVNVSNYYVRNVHNTTVINNITVINNVNRGNGHAYLRGPQANNVERFTHSAVRPVAIRPAERPGAAAVRNGQVSIYRPAVQNNNASARPAQVRDLHALRPVNNRPEAAADRPGNAPGRPAQPADRPSQPAGQRPGQPDRGALPRSNPSTQPREVHPSNPGQPPGQQPHPTPADRPVQRPPVQQQPHQQPPHQQLPVSRPPAQQPHPVQQPRPAQPHPIQPPHPAQPRQGEARPNPAPRPMPQQRPEQRPATPPPHPEHQR
ncbi:hypothetical protein Q4E93_11995 [Flavitalea sp. BT771]|uniref:DUF6600 domain-containing protein n=1 Tax=Flavitalea sp. BT771 TaxID=3063329 RepID=UPI0026E32DC7|nr:DUF6600 domain-containing protein [Flavitalea sp. BT771]MDO6431315.1 hypothetical protein [Flavitalea sp. BT771]MDV6220223.1 DUF6600 domain-containing protein [Flavitalea sp. BT771]